MRTKYFEYENRYLILRCILGIVLVFAASLKGYQLLNGPPESQALTNSLFLAVVVPLEFFLAAWLLTGLYHTIGWYAAVTTFSCFGAVALTKAISGDASCGCFGAINISPWYALILDLASVTALLVIRPRTEWNSAKQLRRPALTLILILATVIPFTFAFGRQPGSSLSFDGQVIGTNQVVLLEPSTWVGRRLPLIPYIDVSDPLESGSWLVVLYRPDCSSCQALIHRQEATWLAMSNEGKGPQVALIQTSPATEAPSTDATHFIKGRLSNTHKWFVKLPVLMWIQDGSVIKVQHGY